MQRKGVQLWENGPYWADRNIGAEKPEDYGYYFWWGDTVGYKREDGIFGELEDGNWVASDGSSDDYSFAEENTTTYNKDDSELHREGWITEDGVLVPEHDAAAKHWGSEWRMPTYDEFDLLCRKCDWELTEMNGISGYIVRGRGDYASESIFFPAAGIGYGLSFIAVGSCGYFWSSVPCSDDCDTWGLLFDPRGGHGMLHGNRGYGQSVRAVQGFAK